MPKTVAIHGFHLDDDGDWVADLACGHTQHVRHKPPMQLRPWVLTESGRAAHVGQPLRCLACDMPRLPVEVSHYRSTPMFDEKSVPSGLLQAHQLRAGSWARVVIETGRLLFVFEEASDEGLVVGSVSSGASIEPETLAFVLRPDFPGIVPPTRPHHIALRGAVRFHIDFYR